MMILIIGRMILKKLLLNDVTKKRIMDALRAEAKKTDTVIDDEAVDIFEAGWDVILPVVLGKL